MTVIMSELETGQQECGQGLLTFHAAGETSPVGEDHQRKTISVEVPDRLSCLKRGIWEPDLA